jgi:hypothetical protein
MKGGIEEIHESEGTGKGDEGKKAAEAKKPEDGKKPAEEKKPETGKKPEEKKA